MKKIIRTADSAFVAESRRPIVRTAARGEAVDMDKYDQSGQPNPFHGWTLDFPESVPHEERTYSNKGRAQGWYDDPENRPHFDSKWGGSGDYADRTFYNHTNQFSQHDPTRGDMIDPSGALGQYGIGEEDLNQYQENGHGLSVGDYSYPENSFFSDGPARVIPTREEREQQQRDQQERREQAQRERVGRPPQYGTPPQNRYFSPGEGPSLPEGHNHEEHDDFDNATRVFGLWHGGPNYAESDPRQHMETFPSMSHAMRAVEGRFGNYNRGHGGETATYHPGTGTYHLTGDTSGSDGDTPGVGHESYMDIYPAWRSSEGDGWHVGLDEGPSHRIWPDEEGDAYLGSPGEHEQSMEGLHARGYDYDEDPLEDYRRAADGDEDEEQGSYPEQRSLTQAGFAYHPSASNGDTYVREDHNGNTHVVRAPNPRYGAMSRWQYEFEPHNEQDTDPYAPRDASRDGPRSLTFSADTPGQAYNLHQNLGNDLSELAHRGWGIHKINIDDARGDHRASGMGSNHWIEAQRRDGNDSGYDRILRVNRKWHAQHVPDGPNGASSIFPTGPDSHLGHSSRREVLDEADTYDAHHYLTSRAADHGSYHQDQNNGRTTWMMPRIGDHSYEPGDQRQEPEQFTVHQPGSDDHNPRWIVTHSRGGRTLTHTSHPTWYSARRELQGRV